MWCDNGSDGGSNGCNDINCDGGDVSGDGDADCCGCGIDIYCGVDNGDGYEDFGDNSDVGGGGCDSDIDIDYNGDGCDDFGGEGDGGDDGNSDWGERQ